MRVGPIAGLLAKIIGRVSCKIRNPVREGSHILLSRVIISDLILSVNEIANIEYTEPFCNETTTLKISHAFVHGTFYTIALALTYTKSSLSRLPKTQHKAYM